MKAICFSVGLALLLTGCLGDSSFGPSYSPYVDQDTLNKQARAEFIRRPIVKEFEAAGIMVDCELSICASITDSALLVLQSYKATFVRQIDRFKEITLVKESYPHYGYGLDEAFLPAQLTNDVMDEFFEVLSTIAEFEGRVGFRIEFPNNRHLRASVYPLLQILKDNERTLKSEAHRYEVLVVSSVYNRFFPQEKIMQMKIDDLRKSFGDVWSFMSRLFKAQDLFGEVHFDMDLGDKASEATMERLFKNSAAFAPLLAQLQGRRFSFFDWDSYLYVDAQHFLMDIGLSNRFDDKYLTEVFQDQIRIVELSDFIGKRLKHTGAMIQLEGHAQCLDKIDILKGLIKSRVDSIKAIEVGFGDLMPNGPSTFSAGHLFLNCSETVTEMDAVVRGIN